MVRAADYSRLAELIQTRAVARKPVVLVSGKESAYYIDLRLITLSAEGAYIVGNLFVDFALAYELDAVGGPSIAADPIAAAVAAISFQRGRLVNGFMVRKDAKEHGLGRQVEGPVGLGSRVAIVDDTTTTGRSLLEAARAAEAIGCKVEVIMVIVDREEGARELLESHGYKFEAMFSASQLGLV